jgi:hypothetical protein
VNESFGLRIDAVPPARLWSGVGNLQIPADIVEDEPVVYMGAGAILNAPDFQQLINGTAERLEAQISGVSAEAIRLALEEGPSVRGAKVHFVRFDFNDDWQLIGVEYEAVFRADKLSVESNDEEGGGRTRKLTLSIGTEDTNRSRAPLAYFTDQDQRRRSPTDRIFDHVSGISVGTSRRFGPT